MKDNIVSQLFRLLIPNKCCFAEGPTALLITLVINLVFSIFFVQKIQIPTYVVAYGTMSAFIRKDNNSLLRLLFFLIPQFFAIIYSYVGRMNIIIIVSKCSFLLFGGL